jgi:hypothetical protein
MAPACASSPSQSTQPVHPDGAPLSTASPPAATDLPLSLLHCPDAGLHNAITFLQPIKDKHPWISHSDLWTRAFLDRDPSIPSASIG